jgi:hypothetical protein
MPLVKPGRGEAEPAPDLADRRLTATRPTRRRSPPPTDPVWERRAQGSDYTSISKTGRPSYCPERRIARTAAPRCFLNSAADIVESAPERTM